MTAAIPKPIPNAITAEPYAPLPLIIFIIPITTDRGALIAAATKTAQSEAITAQSETVMLIIPAKITTRMGSHTGLPKIKSNSFISRSLCTEQTRDALEALLGEYAAVLSHFKTSYDEIFGYKSDDVEGDFYRPNGNYNRPYYCENSN